MRARCGCAKQATSRRRHAHSSSSAAPPSAAATAPPTRLRSAAPDGAGEAAAALALPLLPAADVVEWVADGESGEAVSETVPLGLPVRVCVATRITVRVDVNVLMLVICAAARLRVAALRASAERRIAGLDCGVD